MSEHNIVWSVAVWVVPLVVAIVFHEVAHGYAARVLGDNTAARMGRLTLNPIRHVDPVGTVVLPLMLALAHAPVFGWAKPVPVVASKLREPRTGMMLVALAGPVTNFVLATLAALVLVLAFADDAMPTGSAEFVFANLRNFLLINVFLGVFNLIPLPPFDGGHVVQGLLPRAAAVHYAKLGRYAFPVMIVLLLVLPMVAPQADVVGRVVAPIAAAVTGALLAFAGALV